MEKHKNYTAQQLKELFGDNWQKAIGIGALPPISPKPIINTFNDFDQETKQIYVNIYNIIKQKNPSKNIQVWATGSRVKGRWKTKEEAEAVLTVYPKARVKYSDYDYCTDAPNIPSKEYFLQQLGIAVDLAGCEGRKILIEIQNANL